jgi:hypothetical protein
MQAFQVCRCQWLSNVRHKNPLPKSESSRRDSVCLLARVTVYSSPSEVKFRFMPLTEVENQITMSVLQRFLSQGKTTDRRDLVTQFKGPAPEAINRLVRCLVLQEVDGNTFLPRLLAFEYCAEEETRLHAKKSLGIVLNVLRGFYEEGVDALSPKQIEERASTMYNLTEPGPLVTGGLYLAKELGVFGTVGSMSPVEISHLILSETIITMADLDGAWDAYVRRTSRYLEGGGWSESETQMTGLDMPRSEVVTNEGLLVLISHSSIDSALAAALINLLRSGLGLLASQIRCSSVDGYRLPAGVNTDAQLRDEIKRVKVLIGLLTPNSLSSTYVLFELGARWANESFMIPLLAGILPHEMRGPQSVLNALSCASDAQLIQLVEDLGRQLQMKPQSVASYLNEVRAVRTECEKVAEGMRRTNSGDSEKLGQPRSEIGVRQENATLKPKLYSNALQQTVDQLLARLSADGRRLLRYLVEHEPVEVSKQFLSEISVDDQTKQFAIAMSAGVVRHKEVRVGSGMLIRTDYEVSQQYRPVLESALYE